MRGFGFDGEAISSHETNGSSTARCAFDLHLSTVAGRPAPESVQRVSNIGNIARRPVSFCVVSTDVG
jgi:hypothetical protein